MKQYIIKQWKNKKITVFLMILGFLIGNIVLSIGTSISVETMKQTSDSNSGNPDKQLEIQVDMKENSEVGTLSSLFEKMANFGEIQVLSLDKVELNKYKNHYQIIPVNFQKSETWHVPIIEGRYFSKEDMGDKEKQVIIGRGVAEENRIETDDSLEINNMECRVIGICGRSNRGTQWDSVIYIPQNDFMGENPEYFSESNFSLVLKSGKAHFIKEFNNIEKEYSEKNIEVSYMYLQGKDNNGFYNSIIITVIATTLVFVIAIINITNLMLYWILERKEDIAVMKAMGADNHYIIKYLAIEIVSMALIGALLGIVLQKIAVLFLEEFLQKNEIYCQVTYVNFMISFAVTVVCGLMATIIPAKQMAKIQPAEGLK